MEESELGLGMQKRKVTKARKTFPQLAVSPKKRKI